MRPRIVLDTNVIISGLLYGSLPETVLDLILEGELELVTSSALFAELEGVLQRKFPHTQQTVGETVAILRELSMWTSPQEVVTAVHEDPQDNRVLECALAAHADVIVSGDKHLLTLQDFRGIPILSPQSFLTKWRAEKP